MPPTSPRRILALLGHAMVLPFRLVANTSVRPRHPLQPTSYRNRHHDICPFSIPPIRFTQPTLRHKGSACKSSNIEWSSRNSRYHFPIVMDCATTRRCRKGWPREIKVQEVRKYEGYDPIKRRRILRRSTLTARTTRTPSAARDSIRANFGRPMKTEGSSGI